MQKPLFRKIDCYMLKADDLDAAVTFYGRLGHELVWRNADAVGFRLPQTDAELVVHRELEPQTDLLVEDADEAYARLIASGATPVKAPFDIAIGRCATVRDPFGNVLVILDQSKGSFVTDADGNVIGVGR